MFGFKMAVYGLTKDQILIFGGDLEYTEEDNIPKEFEDNSELKILNLNDLTVQKIVDDEK